MVMRGVLWLLIFMGCAAPRPRTPEESRPPSSTTRPDPVIASAEAALAKGDVTGARESLEQGRWFADDRARAALLLYGCLLLEDRVPDAVAALREYLEKTTRPLNPRDHTAVRLLRHHATGGGLKPGNPEEACYFGLYAWKALDERTTAVPDLELAVREAPEPERLLAKIALEP